MFAFLTNWSETVKSRIPFLCVNHITIAWNDKICFHETLWFYLAWFMKLVQAEILALYGTAQVVCGRSWFLNINIFIKIARFLWVFSCPPNTKLLHCPCRSPVWVWAETSPCWLLIPRFWNIIWSKHNWVFRLVGPPPTSGHRPDILSTTCLSMSLSLCQKCYHWFRHFCENLWNTGQAKWETVKPVSLPLPLKL